MDSGTSHILYVSEAGNVFFSQLQNKKRRVNAKPFNITEPQLLRHFAEKCVIQVACGNNHSLALCKDGQVFAWGQNTGGQLGVGRTSHSVLSPQCVTSLAGIPLAQIAAGAAHSFALSLSGAVFSWGRNNHGQLGLNDTKNRHLPTYVKLLECKRIVYISCGAQHTALLTKYGLVFTCGAGGYGQLGHKTKSDEFEPRLVAGLLGSKVSQIACGSYHTLVLLASSGKIYSFSHGAKGQVGNGKDSHQFAPCPITFLIGIPDGTGLVHVTMSHDALEPTLPQRRSRMMKAAATKPNNHKRTIAAPHWLTPAGTTAKWIRISGAQGATPKLTTQPVANGTKTHCKTAPNRMHQLQRQLSKGRGPSSSQAKENKERRNSSTVADADSNTKDCIIQPTVRRIFAGANQGFALCRDEVAPVSPEDQSPLIIKKRIATIEYSLLDKWSATDDGEQWKNSKEEINLIFSSAASLNGSFLETSNDDHFKTSREASGVDMSAVNVWFEKLGKNPTLLQEVTNAVENNLIPSLSVSPAGVEALRVCLVLPELIGVLTEQSNMVKLTSLLSAAIVSLEGSQLEILESWWSNLNEFFFKKLVTMYKSASYRLLQETSSEQREFPNELCNCLDILQRLYKINSSTSFQIQENNFYIPPAEVFGDTRISCRELLRLIPYSCIFNMETKIKIFVILSHLRFQGGKIIDENMTFGNNWNFIAINNQTALNIGALYANIDNSTGITDASTGSITVITGNIDAPNGNIDASIGNTDVSTENTNAPNDNVDASTGITDPSTGNIDISTGNTDASTGNIGASTGSIDASTGNIDATTGNIGAPTANIGATHGNIDNCTRITDVFTGNIDATTGNVGAPNGDIDASTGIIDASTGNFDATTGNIDVSTGNIGTPNGNVACTGNTDASTRNIGATTGNIGASNGNIDASTGITDTFTGNIDVTVGSIGAPNGNIHVSAGITDVSTGNIAASGITDASTGITDASTGITDASTGNTASNGNIDASTGNISSIGSLEFSTTIIDAADGMIDVSTGNTDAPNGSINVSTENFNILNTDNSFDFDELFDSDCLNWIDENILGCFLHIDRNLILRDTLVQLSYCNDSNLRGKFKVKFKGEPAIDDGGVSQEFFSIITKELCTHPKIFKLYEESRLVWFPEWDPIINDIFRLVGILCWLALYNGFVADFHFPLALYKKLLNVQPTLDDLKELSPTVGRILQQLLNYEDDDIEEIFCRNFTIAREMDDGSIAERELIPNGQNIPVKKHNRKQFVDAYVDYVFNKSVEKQFKAFSEGFRWAVPLPVVDLFLPVELMAIIHGNTKYDWQLLEQNTMYFGYTKTDEIIANFWEMFHDLTEEEKRHFLAFLTGCDRVPVGGMGSLSITINHVPWDDPDLYFPTAHICNKTLHLPKYSSMEILQERFLRAIRFCKEFGID
ncbi:probable E3 ubiquitin-protein ligase HERC3 isoform X2 [Heterodontus francisci]